MRVFAALVITVAVGVASRRYPIGWALYDKSLGDALYAVAVYLALALVLRKTRPVIVAVLAITWCVAVEFFQATGIPAHYADRLIVKWLIGADFAWHDVACYFVGVAAAVTLDKLVLRRAGTAPGERPV
jgi:hypothetical protein